MVGNSVEKDEELALECFDVVLVYAHEIAGIRAHLLGNASLFHANRLLL